MKCAKVATDYATPSEEKVALSCLPVCIKLCLFSREGIKCPLTNEMLLRLNIHHGRVRKRSSPPLNPVLSNSILLIVNHSRKFNVFRAVQESHHEKKIAFN